MIKIKSSEDLFNRWKNLGGRISILLPAIVQNDTELAIEQIQEHFRLAKQLRQEFDDLIGETSTYILESEEK